MRIQKWSFLKLLVEKLCSKYVFIYLTYVSYIKLFLTFVPYIFCYLYTYIIPVYIFFDVVYISQIPRLKISQIVVEGRFVHYTVESSEMSRC